MRCSLKNRSSPKRPLLAALVFAWAGVLFELGAAKNSQHGAPESAEIVRLFLLVFAISFPILYALRVLGLQIGWLGCREVDDPSKRPILWERLTLIAALALMGLVIWGILL
jgi:hypothetical protein